MMQQTKLKEIVVYKCLKCGGLIDIGYCGYHREETDHIEFEPIYKKDF